MKMNCALYEALISVGVPADKARAAAMHRRPSDIVDTGARRSADDWAITALKVGLGIAVGVQIAPVLGLLGV